ncbi:MAG: HAMP domain-containing histidine kinase [Clostridiaceae bacterium]|nr:HAMP domain-containing histidine kinase [Clostridiaceae bacterium]
MKFSIRYKFALGHIVIFILCLFALTNIMKSSFDVANEKIIKEEMESLHQSSSDYITQNILINKLQSSNLVLNNSMALNKYGSNLVKELSDENQCSVGLYTLEGNILFTAETKQQEKLLLEDTLKIGGSNKDLEGALKGKASYVINHSKNRILVNYSYPLYISEVNRGVVRLSKDYTDLYKINNNLLRNITLFIVISFGAIYLFSYLLVNQITMPIIRLSKASREISKGNYDAEIIVNTKDEVGDLAKDFFNMKNKIKEQITTINMDKDKLLNLERQRKSFFDNVTHELKTPLTTISGYAQIISEEDFQDKEFLKRALEHIKTESARLHNMVVELLDISKLDVYKESDNFQMVTLGNILNKVCEDMNLKAEKYEMSIKHNIEANMKVLGDSNQLTQVFINIIDNAIKYGRVKSCIKVQGYTVQDDCEITIENKGRIIPKESLERIFEAFYRVDKQGSKEKGSNGLGLFISKSIIEKHNGSIRIESNSDELVKVIINMPLVTDTNIKK